MKKRKPSRKPVEQYKKSLGQNFIEDEQLLNAFIDAASVGEEDAVLEIGAGLGTLTAALEKRCRRILSVEIDDDLFPVLRVMFSQKKKVELLHADILKLDLSALLQDDQYHVVANIPYYLTTELLQKLFFLQSSHLSSINLLVQKEAGEKITAQPGSKTYGPLSVFAAYFGTPSIALWVDRKNFMPSPNVDSVFVTIPLAERTALPFTDQEEPNFCKLVRCAFASRRKTLMNNLLSSYSLPKEEMEKYFTACGIPLNARAEEVSCAHFANLAKKIHSL